ncbi:MAG TPA: hypothetical protein VGB77_20685 [Abditibacteriaceae bacterium]
MHQRPENGPVVHLKTKSLSCDLAMYHTNVLRKFMWYRLEADRTLSECLQAWLLDVLVPTDAQREI